LSKVGTGALGRGQMAPAFFLTKEVTVTYSIVPKAGAFYVVYAGRKISSHANEILAKDAAKRYEAGDKMRGTHRRSRADTAEDLTR
jgi:hypothetical protein